MESFEGRLFNLTRSLARMTGMAVSDNKKIEEQKIKMAKGQKLLHLKNNSCWPALEEVFSEIHDEAVQAVSNRALGPEQKQPFIHTLETLGLIQRKIDEQIRAGELARDHYNRLKEKSANARKAG